jgi:hypothetical protein
VSNSLVVVHLNRRTQPQKEKLGQGFETKELFSKLESNRAQCLPFVSLDLSFEYQCIFICFPSKALYDKAFLNEHPANESAENRKLEDFTSTTFPYRLKSNQRGKR